MPDFLWERFVEFESDFNGKNWEEFYQAVYTVKSEFPDAKLRDKPYIYVDINAMTSGYIFIDAQSGKVLYVHS